MDGLREIALTPEAPPAFATLAEVKAHLNITDASQDTTLQRLLDAAPVILEAYACTLLKGRAVVETVFPECPVTNYVVAYPSLAGDVALTIDGVAVPSVELYTSKQIGAVRRIDGAAITGQVIVATYATKDVPTASLIYATSELIRDQLEAKSRSGAVTREQIEGVGAVEYASGGADLMKGPSGVAVPLSVGVALSPYVRRFGI